MPLSEEVRAPIRANLKQLQAGNRVLLVVIGYLTAAQLAAINDRRKAYGCAPVVAQVALIGRHVYASRAARDGYSIEDVIDQITSTMSAAAVALAAPHMTAF